jgi:hypothetical protein
MPKNRYSADPKALFQPAPTPTRTPFQIKDGQSWLQAVADATGRHRVGRTQTGDDLTFTEEGGSYLSVTPAGSPDELAAQINRLRETFEVHEGRPPSELDDAFWEAVNALYDAYDGPELGNVADVMGGLS